MDSRSRKALSTRSCGAVSIPAIFVALLDPSARAKIALWRRDQDCIRHCSTWTTRRGKVKFSFKAGVGGSDSGPVIVAPFCGTNVQKSNPRREILLMASLSAIHCPLSLTILQEIIVPAVSWISMRQTPRSPTASGDISAYKRPVFRCSCITCFTVSKSSRYILSIFPGFRGVTKDKPTAHIASPYPQKNTKAETSITDSG